MRILFVEDNNSFAGDVQPALISVCKNLHIDLASDAESARNYLRDEYYDLIILDLCIPAVAESSSRDVVNGQSIFYEAQTIFPGTPIYILTGSEPDSFAMDLSRHGEKLNLWGGRTAVPTVLYFPKDLADKLVNEVKTVADELEILDQISINTRGKRVDFSIEQRRALRVFTRMAGGESCTFSPMGGLSGAIVGRLSVIDDRGNVLTICVAKLGSTKKVRRESESYENHVKLMKMHAFAPLLNVFDKGLKQSGAIFYSLADGYNETLFDVLTTSHSDGVKILLRVREGLDRWTGAKKIKRVGVRDMRRASLNDEDMLSIQRRFDLRILDDVESLIVRASSSCIHGDLHGGNILINRERVPVLIDFGDVGEGFTCIDPVTLEMSLLFHPDAVELGLAAQLSQIVTDWPEVETYTRGTQLGSVIESCRNWAYDVGGDDSAVLAAGYCFAIRQLKYDDVDHGIALQLVNSIAKKLLQR